MYHEGKPRRLFRGIGEMNFAGGPPWRTRKNIRRNRNPRNEGGEQKPKQETQASAYTSPVVEPHADLD